MTVSLADFFRKRAKRTLPAAIAGLWTLAGGCDGTSTDAPPSLATFDVTVPGNFTRHTARGGHIAIRTPATWRETSTSGTIVLNLRTDKPASSLNVQVLPAVPGETLDKTMVNVPDLLRHEFADFKEIKNDLIFLNDLPAGRLVYEASRGGFHGRVMEVFITKHQKHYILTYTATPEHFEVEEPVVEQVVASIEIGE